MNKLFYVFIISYDPNWRFHVTCFIIYFLILFIFIFVKSSKYCLFDNFIKIYGHTQSIFLDDQDTNFFSFKYKIILLICQLKYNKHFSRQIQVLANVNTVVHILTTILKENTKKFNFMFILSLYYSRQSHRNI